VPQLLTAGNKRSSATEPGSDAKRRRTDDIQQAPPSNSIEKMTEDLKKEAQAVLSALKQDTDERKQLHFTTYTRANNQESNHYQALEKVVDLVNRSADKMAAVVGQRVAFLEREVAVHERELAVHKREMVEIREALNLKKRSDLDSPFNV
jgi:GrpB-like predicted nucleotidyltransferase (UPF0157 family)